MGFLKSLFGRNTSETDIKKSIVAYCYGNMISLSNGNIKAYIETFKENPTKALKSRIFSAGKLRAGTNIDINDLTSINAKIISLNQSANILIFDFNQYGGVFYFESDTPAIAPSYVVPVRKPYKSVFALLDSQLNR